MPQHFLLSAAARSLSLAQVARLSDEEALAKFCELRWHDNGGKPYCPHCGGAEIYTFETRRLFKCKACRRQFSATSGIRDDAARLRGNALRRVGRQNIRELWAALALIREAIEDCAPPGSVANSEYLLPEPGREAEALVRGIYAIAEKRDGNGHYLERPSL